MGTLTALEHEIVIWFRTKRSCKATRAKFGMSQGELIDACHVIRQKLGLADGVNFRNISKTAISN